jgi:DNA polymerase-3 subunit gamma/tau
MMDNFNMNKRFAFFSFMWYNILTSVFENERGKIMAYVALYRSYRPSSFKEVIGQKHVVQTLKNAVMENKTSHAYIFSGLRGIGKTTIARIFAKAVNCENQIDGEPCNHCKNCLAIINNETTDIVELDAASNNGVDEMREILEKVNFLPSVLRKKVYIIDEAHMLSTAAFNALLKTLEEPPSHVIFILATTEPHKIPATILSRCQRFDFKQFTLEELKEELQLISSNEKMVIHEEALSAIAEAADGGMRDALGILDQASVFSNGEITVDDINSVTGRISNYKLIELIRSFKKKDATHSIYLINELISMGKEVSRLVGGIIQFCRDILLYKSVNDELVHKYIYDNEAFKELASDVTTSELFYYIDVLVDVQNKIRFTNSQKIYLEVGVMKIINSASEDIDVLSKIHKLEEVVGEKETKDGFVNNQDLDNKFTNLDNRIKKVATDLEKAKIDEFKEKIESKLDLLEDVSSKNAALPTDLMFRLDNIEDKIRVLNTTNQEIDSKKIEEVSEKLKEIEEKLNPSHDLSNEGTNNELDKSTLQMQIGHLEEKLKNLESENLHKIDEEKLKAFLNLNLEQRMKSLEEYVETFIQKEDHQAIDLDKEEIINEINELKENYFVLIQTIQENVKKSHVDLKDELGFDLEDTSNHTNIEQMVNELIANVNRIADKMNENTNNINNINNEITTINEINHIQEENINKVFAKIEQINLNNKNDIYDKMFDDVQTQIDDLKNSEDAIKEDLSKMKQLVKSNNENKEMTKQVETKTEAAVEKVQTEYTRPKEEPRVVETNETKTLQRIKNVYDIRIVERILHEARELECREEKARLIHAWSKLEDKVGYVLAPVAKILLDGKMVANGKHEILIVYPSATICNHLMEPKNYVDAKQVLRITFGKDYDFLALPENTWQEKRSEYIGQYGVGIKYPKLSPIHNPELNVVTVNYNQMNTLPKKPLQQAKAFFGSAIVEEEER